MLIGYAPFITREPAASSNTGSSHSSHFCNKKSYYEGRFHDIAYTALTLLPWEKEKNKKRDQQMTYKTNFCSIIS